MRHWWAALAGAALVLGAVGLSAAGADVESGLPVGGSTRPFSVLDVTGPAKGSTLCYV